MKTDHLMAEKRALLKAALPEVPFSGWTDRILIDAAKTAGLEPTVALRAFPGGVVELVDFFVAEADRTMVEALQAGDLDDARIPQRVARAIRLRLEQQAGHKEAVRRAAAFYALPLHSARALKGLYRTVDAIWYAVSDTSTDFSFYTKRLTLAAVYGSTLAYWLQDRSEGHAATWDFLERRLRDIGQIPKLRRRFNDLAAGVLRPGRDFMRRPRRR
jgi:ubiquinone biosynthesis protein COQ9